jgi:hypothetical protein
MFMDLNISSLLIGILVMLSAYLALSRVVDVSNTSVKKSLAVFTAALGLLSTLWLQDNPAVLRQYSEKIVIAGLGIVLALLAFARKSLK